MKLFDTFSNGDFQPSKAHLGWYYRKGGMTCCKAEAALLFQRWAYCTDQEDSHFLVNLWKLSSLSCIIYYCKTLVNFKRHYPMECNFYQSGPWFGNKDVLFVLQQVVIFQVKRRWWSNMLKLIQKHIFMVKSYFNVLISSIGSSFLWKCIWRNNVPSRIAFLFGWWHYERS